MSDDAAVTALYLALIDGWNRRDAAAMAACFAEGGQMIGFDGSLAVGRAEIERHLAPIFQDHPTAPFTPLVRSVTDVAGAVLLRADVGMAPAGAREVNAAANARQTLLASRQGGTWKVDLFQNTPAALHGDDAGRAALTAELNAALGGA